MVGMLTDLSAQADRLRLGLDARAFLEVVRQQQCTDRLVALDAQLDEVARGQGGARGANREEALNANEAHLRECAVGFDGERTADRARPG